MYVGAGIVAVWGVVSEEPSRNLHTLYVERRNQTQGESWGKLSSRSEA